MRHRISSIALFFVWPIVAFVAGFFRRPQQYPIIFLFTCFAALTVFPGGETDDIVKQRIRYERLAESNITLKTFVKSLYNDEERTLYKNFDIVESSVWFICAQIGVGYRIMFLCLSLLIGFVYVWNLKLLSKWFTHLSKHWYLIALITFVFIKPFWMINGFRFHFASMVAFTASIYYFIERKNGRALFIWLLTPLVHFGYLFFVLVPIVIHYFRNYSVSAVVFAIIGSLFNSVNTIINLKPVLESISPQGFYLQAEHYIEEDKVVTAYENLNINKSIHAAYYQESLHIFILLTSVVFYFLLRKFKCKDKIVLERLNIVLFIIGIVSILDTVPGANRFAVIEQIGYYLLLLSIFVRIKNEIAMKRLKSIIVTLSPLFLLWAIVEIRKSWDILTLATIFPSLMVGFQWNDFPLIELIK